MLTDSFSADWLAWLDAAAANVDTGERLYLFLDGAFVPGLHRTLSKALLRGADIGLLFENLPGCSEEVRDVSPLLMPYVVDHADLAVVLARCSGWPMVSAIVTSESLAELTQRLAAWCVVEVDDQRFNFRFPDTRRLPGIFATLTNVQRATLAGPASAWYYINRAGKWEALPAPRSKLPVADSPRLEAAQFSVMVAHSEPDEILLLLQDRGRQWEQAHSAIYNRVGMALRIADAANLEAGLRVDWCGACLDEAALLDDATADENLAQWRNRIEV